MNAFFLILSALTALQALFVVLLSVPEGNAFVVFNCERWNCPCAGQEVSSRGKRSLVDHSEHTHRLAADILSDIVSELMDLIL